MSLSHVGQTELIRFAEDHVNLPRDLASRYRSQVNNLRDRLESYLAEHPDFTLRKMLLSGSLAKSTALKSLNDIDVACYISGADAPNDIQALLGYLATRLRTAFPNFSPDQVKPQTYSVRVSFKGTGLDVDVVPILYDDDPNWYGNLVSQDDGSLLATSIPRHLEFSLKRRKANEKHFAQVVRLLKYWARKEKQERDGFRFKSFMIELLVSHLADNGEVMSDYANAMQSFFTFIARSDLTEKILFEDYFRRSAAKSFTDRIQIIDPVNPENNVSRLYTSAQAKVIVDAALDAGDAIDAALYAPTKQETVRYWQKVFGSSFSA
jgi:tRNA nucleotidyltransferase (CCA-adding enzyme)